MNYRFVIFLLFYSLSVCYPKVNYYLTYNIGYFIQHSENSMPITFDDDYQESYGISGGIDYQITNNKFIQISFEHYETKLPLFTKVVNFEGELLSKKEYGSLTEESYPLDIRLFISENKMTGYGYGLTFVGTNHSLFLDRISDTQFKDIFNSTGVGINGITRFSFKLSQQTYLLTDIVLRYVKAIRFNGGNRNFSNYNHQYFQISVSIGIGRKY